MITPVAVTPNNDLELVLARLMDVRPDALFRCWTDPALLAQWFAPEPLTTEILQMDVRPGGSSRIVMRGPDGAEYPASGVYLEVVPNSRLVFTDAFTEAWVPSAKPFMTAEVTFEPRDGGTLYTARARHWTAEDRDAHVKMGFHEGWGLCAEQLARLAATL